MFDNDYATSAQEYGSEYSLPGEEIGTITTQVDSSTSSSNGSSIQQSDFETALSSDAIVTEHSHTSSSNVLPEASEDFVQSNGTPASDIVVGGDENNFFSPGEDAFELNTATTSGGDEEFPFPNSSSGSTELNLDLNTDGVLTVDGSFENFDGAPLFSQGETEIDPNAEILNGSDPESLIESFLAVPADIEGNEISGTHLHFSPAGDDREDFADATVVRYLDDTINENGTSGDISAELELTPEEQAALLAGNLYVNVHSNIDADADGTAGFPTGENRVNINQEVVQFT